MPVWKSQEQLEEEKEKEDAGEEVEVVADPETVRYRILKEDGGPVLVANILKETKRRSLDGEHLLAFNPPELTELLLQRGKSSS